MIKARKINDNRIVQFAQNLARERLLFCGKEHSCHLACFIHGKFKGFEETLSRS